MKSKQEYMIELLNLRNNINQVLDVIDNEVKTIKDPKTNTRTFALTGDSILKIVKLLALEENEGIDKNE